jgi:putative sterol carrier protein
MTEPLPFFSAEWCEAALEACNAEPKVIRGFREPAKFSHRMEFGCLDRDLASHVEWVEGKVTAWGPPKYDEDDLWLKINGDLATWKLAASGETEAGKLLMAGKIKFGKGPMSAAIENGGAFNNFIRAWGNVPTEWPS